MDRKKQRSKRRLTFGVVESGHAIGEAHHRAKLTDEDVELIRDIYDEGMASYSTLANVFGVKKSTIRDIITFRKRASTPHGYKTVDAANRKPLPKSRLRQLGIDVDALTIDEDWDGDH